MNATTHCIGAVIVESTACDGWICCCKNIQSAPIVGGDVAGERAIYDRYAARANGKHSTAIVACSVAGDDAVRNGYRPQTKDPSAIAVLRCACAHAGTILDGHFVEGQIST